MKAVHVLAATVLAVCLAGCVRPKWEDMTQVAALASQISTERAHELFDNSFEISGTVVKIDEHSLPQYSASGARAFTYHVEYNIHDPSAKTSPDEEPKLKAYVLQLTRHSFKPMFRIGDNVVLNGWLARSADECAPVTGEAE